MTLHQLKRDLAGRSARGISNIIAGVLLWSVFGALGLVLPDGHRHDGGRGAALLRHPIFLCLRARRG